jgi:hypothetical protein
MTGPLEDVVVLVDKKAFGASADLLIQRIQAAGGQVAKRASKKVFIIRNKKCYF